MPDVTLYDVTVAAQSYSQIAATIAGFAFVILVWMVESLLDTGDQVEIKRNEMLNQGLVFMAITFVASLVVALLYGLVSGDVSVGSSRPGILNFLVGLNFTSAIPLSMLAMVFFVASARLWRITPIFRNVFLSGVLLGWLFQWSSTLGLLRTLSDTIAIIGSNSGIFYILFPLTLLPLIAGLVLSLRPQEQRLGLNSAQSFNRFSTYWLFFIVLTTAIVGYYSSLGPDAILPQWLIWVLNLSWAILMGWASAFLPARSQE